jgi:AAA+ superfamily predicted ATPase
VERAFERAREVGKCFFILEDLDTLLTASNRTYFLNELDGFAANHGIITIATCNFAELLDPAITERPSRFDRKVHFNLPSPTERRRYLALYQERFEPEMRLGDDGLHQITAATEGFSFAYLKELMVSSAMHWVSFDGAENFQDVVSAQVTSLGEQMKTEWKKMKEASVSTQGHSADESEGFDGD